MYDLTIIKMAFRKIIIHLYYLFSHSQTFKLMAEALESMAAYIGRGPPMSPFDQHVKQPITVRFNLHHISGSEMSLQ